MAAMILTVALSGTPTPPPPHAILESWLTAHQPALVAAPPAVESEPTSPRLGLDRPSGVEQWRSLVAEHFPPEHVDAALTVMACESGGDPGATNPSGAAGLFQAMPQWWTGQGWSNPSPYGPFDPYDPAASVRFAAWLSDQGANWSAWVCQP